MRVKFLFVLIFVGFTFVTACDSGSETKYLKITTDMLLPQAAIDKAYDFTFTVTYGEDKWDATTGFEEAELIWSFDNWELNGSEQTEGPGNLTFEDGKITGTPDATEGGLWSFDVTIEKGKTVTVETFYLPIAQNVEIMTDKDLPFAVTDLPYTVYLDARFGQSPYYWSFDNWTKDGSPVSDPPVGITPNKAGFISGSADNSEAGTWTFDATVYDTSVPVQMTEKKTFEFEVKLKLSVPTNYPTIQAAIDIAENGQTVYLENQTFQGAGNRDLNFNGKSLTILGNAQDPSQVVIDCQGSSSDTHRAFYFASAEKNCVIDGVTIKNGYAPIVSSYHRGAVLFASGSVEVTFQNCVFEDNKTTSTTATIYGGLLYAESSARVKFKSSQIKNTETSTTSSYYVYGGNFYITSSVSLTLEDVDISGTHANSNYYLYGGEIYESSSEFNMKNVTITGGDYSNGYYYVYGGLMYSSSCTENFDNVTIAGFKVTLNSTSSGYFYGLMYNTSCTLIFNNVTIANAKSEMTASSSSYFYAGVSYTSSCSSKFTNCNFTNLVWEYKGTYSTYYFYGMFYLTSSSSTWTDCVFARNQLIKSSYTGYFQGGIAYLSSHTAKFTRCHFLGNVFESSTTYSTYSYGGGVRIYSSSTGEFNDCVFAYNYSDMCGAAINCSYSSANCTINNTTIFRNEGYAGGGVFSYGNCTINNSIIWENVANYDGNQIYVYNTSYIPNINNSCYGNQAGDVYSTINPVSCVNTDPFFKDTGDNPVTGDCTFSDSTMTVTGTPGTSAFLSEIKRGDGIYLTSDGDTAALFVLEVVSDTELKVAGYYTGTPGTGAATVKKMDFTPQHTNKGDANDSPCVDAGDNSKSSSSVDILGKTRIVDGNGNSTPTIDMGAYELQ